MKPTDIISKYYKEGSALYELFMQHAFSVADKALTIAQSHPEMNLDKSFVYEAAMLHDIGIYLTDAPKIYCFGTYPYVCHGYLGSELLVREGYPKHALVSERHTGTGISKEEIIAENLPLPVRDMLPVSLEEQLICFADKFYSKSNPDKEKSIDKIRKGLSKHGDESVNRFDAWCRLFLD